MPKIISCGFIVKSKSGKFLLGKATAHPEPFCFTIFKGQQEPYETFIATAIRELKEETGIDIASIHDLNRNISTNPIYSFSMKEKDVHIFLLDDVNGVLDQKKFICTSFWGDPPQPEISEYKWVEAEEINNIIFPSQRGIVNALKNKGII